MATLAALERNQQGDLGAKVQGQPGSRVEGTNAFPSAQRRHGLICNNQGPLAVYLEQPFCALSVYLEP